MTSQSNSHHFQVAVVSFCGIALAFSLVAPRYPREQWLQHVPTVISLAALSVAVQRKWLSSKSLTFLAAMLLVHIVGARWIYSYVPYDHWWESLFGSRLNQQLGWERNHYDRFTHLAFGILVTPPLCESATRYLKMSVIRARWAAVLIVLAVSAVYEVFEWLLAVTAAPELADRYNGQQGDMWDAQKDMALALLGSLCAVGCATFVGCFRSGHSRSGHSRSGHSRSGHSKDKQ